MNITEPSRIVKLFNKNKKNTLLDHPRTVVTPLSHRQRPRSDDAADAADNAVARRAALDV